ncbi:MAG TPA: XrtA/PEP-CTERM system TPR-repeat protein PrsT [Steroidobacteraceae bacterium]|nr:XrtA/PEP-CTERM system TPR-repeat protein PrsT [Steroidobacteraceae bacterium]
MSRHLGVLLLCLGLAACNPGPDELLKRAQRNLEAGDLRAASIDLKTLLQGNPNNAEARFALGRAMLAGGDAESAIREFELARGLGVADERLAVPTSRALLASRRYEEALKFIDADKAPNDSQRRELLIMRGDAQLGAGRAREALAEFERALSLDANDVAARLGVASARLETDGFAAAKQEADIALKQAPENPRAHLVLATLYLRDRQFEAATKAFDDAVRLTESGGGSNELLTALAGQCEAQLALGRAEEADATIERLEKLAPGSSVTLYLQARAAFIKGEYDVARTDLERILARDPSNRPAQLLLGAVNYASGNLGQADMHLAAVLAAEPENDFARQLLAESRLRQRKPREALSVLEQEGAAQPNSALTLALAGTARVQAGDLDAGLQYLERGAAAKDADPGTVIQLAAGYIAAGRTETAVRILDSLKVEGSTAYRRDLLMITAQLRSGDRAGAIEHAVDLAQRNPAAPEVQALVGGLLVSAGDNRQARARFEKALELAPKSPAAHLNLGKLDLLEGHPDRAEKRFQEALRLKPREPAALVALAQAALAKGNREAAVKWLETARKDNPLAVEPRVLLAQYYLGQHDLQRAESLASEAIRLAPDNAGALNVLGVTLASAGRTRDSVDALNRAVAANPNSARVHFSLATAYLAAGEVEQALSAARKALELAPGHVPSMALVAALESARGHETEARRLLDEIRKADPAYPGLAMLEAELSMRSGNPAAAVKIYDQAMAKSPSASIAVRAYAARRAARTAEPRSPLEQWLQSHPEDTRVRFVYADALAASGDTAGAAQNLERVLRTEPDNVTALNNLSWLYFQAGDERALALAQRAHALRPKSPQITDTLGWILLSQGEVPEAVRKLSEAVALAPKEPNIAYHHAAALARSGARSEASRQLKTLLADYSDFSERKAAQELLAQLGR